jgi:hypothetical protein
MDLITPRPSLILRVSLCASDANHDALFMLEIRDFGLYSVKPSTQAHGRGHHFIYFPEPHVCTCSRDTLHHHDSKFYSANDQAWTDLSPMMKAFPISKLLDVKWRRGYIS